MSNKTSEPSAEEMELINKLSRRELSPEEVYVFPLLLCDNELDRDGERFSPAALTRLAELFVGKTGIFDHDPKGSNQTARIYSASAETDPTRTTRCGEPYVCVKAKAYMMRTAGSADLIKEIDGGIKKEVSVSCSVAKKLCSVCGANLSSSPCAHVKGSVYGGKLCSVILDEPTDAYEWSFVAVPAQPAAGITKALSEPGSASGEINALRAELSEKEAAVSRACSDITAEIIRLGQFCTPAYSPDSLRSICSKMTIPELLALKERTRREAAPGPASPQLTAPERACEKNSRFKLHV